MCLLWSQLHEQALRMSPEGEAKGAINQLSTEIILFSTEEVMAIWIVV